MRAYNVLDGDLDLRRAKVGDRIGSEKLGASLYELDPGERSWPYHYEYGVEEWLLVVAGRPTLRDPEGEHELREGDVVCVREGPDGAHRVRNDTAEPIRRPDPVDEAAARRRRVPRQRQGRDLVGESRRSGTPVPHRQQGGLLGRRGLTR